MEWFNGEKDITEESVVPIRQRWMCPENGCDGEMIYNGTMWPMSPLGYHHICSKCGIGLAISGEHYPSIKYVNK